jgi:MSHA biogenesis protein MshI
MRWPWRRKSSQDQLIVSWSAQTLAYVRARVGAPGSFDIQQMGVESQGTDSTEDFVRRLQALGFKGREVKVMLRPDQYQILQIDAPAVAPEELRSAARFQIREMVQTHIDDITLDVMRLGDGQQKGTGHLFVVAANNAVLRGVSDLGNALGWSIPVIDIQEMAQRNLQNALAARDARADRAHAALVLVDGYQAVLTISANEELFYTRRLELPDGFMAMTWTDNAEAAPKVDDGFSPVEEYVPDYSAGSASFGSEYAPAPTASGAGGLSSADTDRAQRFLVEVQRSLDLWDRSWSGMPLAGLRVYAGARTQELAEWLSREIGQTVLTLDIDAQFAGLEAMPSQDRAVCFPLLGVLMRTEVRKL